MVTSRRRINHISSITSENGSILSNDKEILSEFSHFYQNLWTNPSNPFTIQLWPQFPSVTDSFKNSLIAPFFKTEIWNTINSMANGKSHGIDDFTVEFYKSYWEIISDDLLNYFHHFHCTGFIPFEWNKIIITSIPKCQNPNRVKDFRPIALCNMSYRILTKLLANRLKVCLPTLIFKEQSAFIKGRSIHNNILVTQEMAHSIFSFKSKKSYIIVKLDLEKTYDFLSWDAILLVLEFCQFPPLFISWIKACISTISFACMMNGNIFGFFQSSKGIRQGDPLSPFLYIIVAQTLTLLINKAVNDNLFTPLRINNTLAISHLMFADDILLAFKADDTSINSFKTIFGHYAQLTGQKVNFQKSAVFFPKYTPPTIKNNICTKLGIHEGSFPFKYLGAVISPRMPQEHAHDFLFDQLNSELDSWQTKYLSQAGRVTLIKYVLTSVPIHSMSISWFSQASMTKINSIISNFLWQDSPDKKGIHLISWSNTTLPKDVGGLGIKNIQLQSISLQARRVEAYLNNHESLWVDLVKTKYPLVNFIHLSPPNQCSWSLRLFIEAFEHLHGGFRKIINFGKNSLVLSNNWCLDIPLCLKPALFDNNMVTEHTSVACLINNQRWNHNVGLAMFDNKLWEQIILLSCPKIPVMILRCGLTALGVKLPLLRLIHSSLNLLLIYLILLSIGILFGSWQFLKKLRNEKLHQARQLSPDSLMRRIIAFLKAYDHTQGLEGNKRNKALILCRWNAPPPNVVKINCDASVDGFVLTRKFSTEEKDFFSLLKIAKLTLGRQ
ncbi:hypothetical protein Cni_G16463 [Canna indica]|uniref:Reverse transcriptase domain-containing protein n=1 Tax=Canna indica TaxID=4628 RepID=A0AAQ3QCK5_9LILI|nr:hypothetical protein Cni_G16463 [Canna indica]